MIFSIKNNGNHKVISLFGIKIKLNRTAGSRKFYKLPIEPKKIVFSNFSGRGFGCNLKYIAEKLIETNKDYDLVWLCDKTFMQKENYPSKIRLVDFKSSDAIKEMITARVVISNVHLFSLISRGWEKRAGQCYINTWHGSLGIKKIGSAVVSEKNRLEDRYIAEQKDSSMIDYILSNSVFDNEVFRNDLWYKGEILEFGHPRNDVFFRTDSEKELLKIKVCKELGIDVKSKIFLYVPSFRDNNNVDCYKLDVERVRQCLNNKTGEDWVVAIRLHPHLAKHSSVLFNYSDKVVDATNYSDIQELLVASEMAVSDYSSCIFDFMISRKPAFIYAVDIKEYNSERGLYYPLETTPFPIATNNDDMIANIENFDENKYREDIETFLKSKGCFEDGKASVRVSEFIAKLIDSKRRNDV